MVETGWSPSPAGGERCAGAAAIPKVVLITRLHRNLRSLEIPLDGGNRVETGCPSPAGGERCAGAAAGPKVVLVTRLHSNPQPSEIPVGGGNRLPYPLQVVNAALRPLPCVLTPEPKSQHFEYLEADH